MYRLFLSLRYVRSRKTNWIGMAGIFVAVAALIVILSIMSGFLNESRKHLRGNLSDLLIQPSFDHPLRGTGELPRRDAGGLLEIVRADTRVKAASAQLVWYGMLAPEGRARVLSDPEYGKIALVSLVGIDFEDEYQSTDLRESMTREPAQGVAAQRVADVDDPFAPPPGYDPPGRPEASIVLGEQLAWAWDLRRGTEVEIVTTTLDPDTGRVRDPINQRFVVAGTFRSGENDMDLQRIYFDRRVLADWLGDEGGFSEVLVKLQDYEGEKVAVASDLGERLHAAGYLHDPTSGRFLEIKTWEDFRRTMLAAIENEKTLMGIMLSLVMVVAGFTVFAILSMMVTEKRRDIGILAALGGTRAGIGTLFLLIGLWEALIGATLGTLAGIWGALKIDPFERWLSSTFDAQIFNRDVYLFDHIPSAVNAMGVALIVLGAVVCTLVFAALPAWRAASLDPVDALRYE